MENNKYPCGCERPNTSCASCRTPEEDEQYWHEKASPAEWDEE